MIKHVLNVVKGFFIGLALVVPGLSGATFAVVMGVYEGLIHALNHLLKDFKNNMLFLLPLGFGIAVGILASASGIIFLIEYYPMQSYSFFIGLVLGSLAIIFNKLKPGIKKPINYPILLLGLSLVVVMTLFVPDSGDEAVAIASIDNIGHFITILSAGVISCFLMAVPGVSGAVILMLLGHFGTVYGAVSNFADVLLMALRGEGGALELGLSSGFIVLTFFVGALIGVFGAARIAGFLIERFEASVYFAVMGLVVGAVYTLFVMGVGPGLADSFDYSAAAGLLAVITISAAVAAGYLCISFMSRKERGAQV